MAVVKDSTVYVILGTLGILCHLAFWGVLAFVAYHFITKFW